MDPSLMIHSEKPHDMRDGEMAYQGMPQVKVPGDNDQNLGHAGHMNEHISAQGEHDAPLPHDHMKIKDSKGPGQGLDGGAAEADLNMDDEIMDHADRHEYHRMKGMKPRSLGERAKMDMMHKKYSGEKV